MQQIKKISAVLITGILTLGVFLTWNSIKTRETFANDQTYTYVTRDGVAVATGVRNYTAGDFTITHRKNDASYNIATTYSQLRVYAKQSLEFYPTEISLRYITGLEITTTHSTYASALANATLVAGADAETATPQSGIATTNVNIASFDLTSITNCGFFKLTVTEDAYLSSLKIIHDLAPLPVYRHEFIFGDLGLGGTIPNSSVLLSGLSWQITSSWQNNESGYSLGYEETHGLIIGEENDSFNSFSLRSSIPDFAINSIEIYASGLSGIEGTIDVSIGGANPFDSVNIPDQSISNYSSFILDNSVFGHINISFTQTSNQSLYLKQIIINGSNSIDISSAMTFARNLEAFDTCGNGEGLDALVDSYNSLSTMAKEYLEYVKLDDYNNIGQSANTSIQKNVVLATDKWEYITNAFASPSGVGIISNQKTASLLFIVCLSIVTLSCFVFLLYRKHRHST